MLRRRAAVPSGSEPESSDSGEMRDSPSAPQTDQDVEVPTDDSCPVHTAKYTITPVKVSTHLIVSAYKDHRGRGAMRIIAMVNKDRTTSLYCVFCCSGQAPQVAPADVVMHSVHYGYLYAAADMPGLEGPGCKATHVTLTTHLESQDALNQTFLTILTIQNREKWEDFPILQYYAEEGTLEVIDWPINHFLKPSTG
ncbi:uncharacterized protein ACWYII_046573 [Salvelinus alpinus]